MFVNSDVEHSFLQKNATSVHRQKMEIFAKNAICVIFTNSAHCFQGLQKTVLRRANAACGIKCYIAH